MSGTSTNPMMESLPARSYNAAVPFLTFMSHQVDHKLHGGWEVSVCLGVQDCADMWRVPPTMFVECLDE